jgi:uncharacterized protein
VQKEPELIYSPLQQTYTISDKSIEIQIYRQPDTGWTIEVVDEYGNSTVWDDEFATDQLAFDEVMRTITEDGIDSLIGEPSQNSSSLATDGELTAEEIDILDDFLSSESISDTSMDFATLEGYLTSIAIGPRLVRPSDWIPLIWDMDDAENAPEFSGEQEANRIMSMLFRHYNTIVGTFNTAPESFEPIFRDRHRWNVADWCEGFLTGFQFAEQEWAVLQVGQPTWFTPFMRLGTLEGIEITDDQGDIEKWVNEIKPSILKLHGYWKQYEKPDPTTSNRESNVVTFVRLEPKVGRNAPCPCGSSKKFKKCCGSVDASPTMH